MGDVGPPVGRCGRFGVRASYHIPRVEPHDQTIVSTKH